MNSEYNSNKEKLNGIKSISILDNLRTDYFLVLLFNIMKKNKSFEIVKYNQKLQKRLNLNINDYINCTSIELELKLVDKKRHEKEEFINISETEKKYFHIFFNNSTEEIKRNYFLNNEKVDFIKVIIDYQIKSFKELFYNCGCISSIFFKKFLRTNITNMNSMFSGCWSLKSINFSNFNTNNVIDMSYMFENCSDLTELNLTKFNTINVTDMRCMFRDCSSLKKLNISNFNTDNVTNMRFMFRECSSLEKLNISNFNTYNVTDMRCMFLGCSDKLKKKIKQKVIV